MSSTKPLTTTELWEARHSLHNSDRATSPLPSKSLGTQIPVPDSTLSVYYIYAHSDAEYSLQNDFNTEGINAKSNALLATVQGLKAQNLIDGVGFQSHFIVGQVPTDLQANLQRFVNAGVEVALTELDIRVSMLYATLAYVTFKLLRISSVII